MKKLTPEDFEKAAKAARKDTGNWIKVGMSTCGVAAGADAVFNTLVDESKRRNIQIEIKKCGCLGMCYAEPLVEVCVEGLPTVVYGRVDKDVAVKILDKHVCGGMLVNDNIYDFTSRKLS